MPRPAPNPTAFTKPRIRHGALPSFLPLCSQPDSLCLPQQPCARQTCPSCGKARVPQGSLLRTAAGRRGWTSPAQLLLLPRSPAPPRSPHPSPTTPYPTDNPLCSHLGETGRGWPWGWHLARLCCSGLLWEPRGWHLWWGPRGREGGAGAQGPRQEFTSPPRMLNQ